MSEPTWADSLSAWSTFATAVLTLLLVVLALAAWSTASRTLRASTDASTAARESAEAARAANEQAKIDSIEQTRPYVYVEVVTGLASKHSWDVRIRNAGRSAARDLRLDFDGWPTEPDEVSTAVSELFKTGRTLPPDCQMRALWRAEGRFTDGTTEVGLGTGGKITVTYTSDDPSTPVYTDIFDVMIKHSGYTPIAEDGPTPDGLKGDLRKFYVLGQALVRRVGELGR